MELGARPGQGKRKWAFPKTAGAARGGTDRRRRKENYLGLGAEIAIQGLGVRGYK